MRRSAGTLAAIATIALASRAQVDAPGGAREPVRVALRELVEARDGWRREEALRALVLGDAGAGRALAALARSARGEVRMAVLRALAARGELEDPAGTWISLAREGRRRARRLAAWKLGEIPGRRAAAALRALAGDAYDDVAAAAVASLGARMEDGGRWPMPDERSFPTLRRLWAECAPECAPTPLARALRGGAPALREDLLEVLAWYGVAPGCEETLAALRKVDHGLALGILLMGGCGLGGRSSAVDRGALLAQAVRAGVAGGARRALLQRALCASGAGAVPPWEELEGFDLRRQGWLLECLPWIAGASRCGASLVRLWHLPGLGGGDPRPILADLLARLDGTALDPAGLAEIYRLTPEAYLRRCALECAARSAQRHRALLLRGCADADSSNRRVAFNAVARALGASQAPALERAVERERAEVNYGPFGRALARWWSPERARSTFTAWLRSDIRSCRRVALYGLEALPPSEFALAPLEDLYRRARAQGEPSGEVLRILALQPGSTDFAVAAIADLRAVEPGVARDLIDALGVRAEHAGAPARLLAAEGVCRAVRVEAAIRLATGGERRARDFLAGRLPSLAWDQQVRAFEAICSHPWPENITLIKGLEEGGDLAPEVLLEGCVEMLELEPAARRVRRALAASAPTASRQAVLRSLARGGDRGRHWLIAMLQRAAAEPRSFPVGDLMALLEACRESGRGTLLAPLAGCALSRLCAACWLRPGGGVRHEIVRLMDLLAEWGDSADAELLRQWREALAGGRAAKATARAIEALLFGWGEVLPRFGAALASWLLRSGDGDAAQRCLGYLHRAWSAGPGGSLEQVAADLRRARLAAVELGCLGRLPSGWRPALDLTGSGHLPARWASLESLARLAARLRTGDQLELQRLYEQALRRAFFDSEARRAVLVFGLLNEVLRPLAQRARRRWDEGDPRGFNRLLLEAFAARIEGAPALAAKRWERASSRAATRAERSDSRLLAAWDRAATTGSSYPPASMPQPSGEVDLWAGFRARLWRIAAGGRGGRGTR